MENKLLSFLYILLIVSSIIIDICLLRFDFEKNKGNNFKHYAMPNIYFYKKEYSWLILTDSIEENNLTTVITNEDRYLFFDGDNTEEYLPIYEVVDSKLICHNIKNIKIDGKYDTYPMSVLFSKDTFFVSYGDVLAFATKTDDEYEFEQAVVLYDSVTNISTYTIVGYDNGKVILIDYEWYNRKKDNYQNYLLICYDIKQEKIINIR